MIVTCEKCKTSYAVAASQLEPEGRLVRCSRCDHEWFQLPEKDVLAEEQDLEPIPESVRPVPEGSSVPVIPDEEDEGGLQWGAVFSLAAALFIGALVALGLILFRGPVINHWPASAALYELVGFKTTVKGERLIFDQVSASTQTDQDGNIILNIEGQIMNLSDSASAVPDIQVSLRKDGGSKVADKWIIKPDNQTIEPNGITSFQEIYSGPSADAEEVNLQFVLGH